MKASVIIPAYNAQKTIGMCLDALMKQTYTDYEVIVIDDGSSDNTASIVNAYPVRYVRQENSGPACARNRGVSLSSGEVILFTDSDCIPSQNWISEMVSVFEADPEVVAIKGVYKTNQSQLIARFAQAEFEERYDICQKSKTISMVDTYSAAYKKDIFTTAGGFDESFPTANNEDTELSYKMSSKGYKMVFNPKVVVYHLGHPSSVWDYMRKKFWRGYWRMVVYKRFPAKMIKDAYTPQTLKIQILLLFMILIAVVGQLVVPSMLYLTGIIGVAFFLTTIPFMLKTIKRDLLIGVVSPLYLVLRALAIGGGVFYYFVKKKLND
ncbi:MAG: glycosyltransferase [Candidatus Magnetoovum sp. WYHC-5]|nr:glycosyltransferase [Candidatus Magnetoovum sp. WYHC-5]